MLTPNEKELLQRHVTIDGDGNVVGNDNTVQIIYVQAETYVAEVNEQHITFTLQDLRRVVKVKDSTVGVIGDDAHIEEDVHFDQQNQRVGHQVNVGSVAGDYHTHHHYAKSPAPAWSDGRCDYYPDISLPPHYILRPEILSRVREALLESADSVAITSAIRQAPEALHGMGGIGKTVVARALYDDPKIRATFPDGILWTTLGREVPEADLRRKVRAWIDAVGGVVSETAPTVSQLKSILARQLAERACLLIVDDVWRRTDVETFQVGGPNCRLLITTRDAEIAHSLGARLQPVDVMAREQAIKLLEQWAFGRLNNAGDDVKAEIVACVGYLPLAVKLAGEQLRRHDPEEWLARFDAKRLHSSRHESIHDDLFQTFALSLEDLTDKERRCYTSLAILPEDEAIPLVALIKLWGALADLDEMAVRDLMYDLIARALAQLGEKSRGLSLVIHDLLQDFIIDELGELDKIHAHRALLDAYRATQEGDGWHTMPDDNYVYDHLVYHLGAIANRDGAAFDELRALFADDAWLQKRVSMDDYRYDTYVSDLAQMWHILQTNATHQPMAVVDCLRAILIRITVNSLATTYKPPLVASAIKRNLWSPARGVSVAKRIVDPYKKMEMAKSLLATGRLSSKQCALVRYLGTDALIEHYRPSVWVDLYPHLPSKPTETLLTEALIVIRLMDSDNIHKARALAALGPYLAADSEGKASAEAVAIAREMGDEGVSALVNLAPYLNDELLIKGLERVRAVEDDLSRVFALLMLAQYLPTALQRECLSEGVAVIREIEDEEVYALFLRLLASYLADDPERVALSEVMLSEVLSDVYEFKDNSYKAFALAALIPHLQGDRQKEAVFEGLRLTKDIEDDSSAIYASALMLSSLPSGTGCQISRKLLSDAQNITDEVTRTVALGALISHFEGELKGNILDQILEVWPKIGGNNQMKILSAIAGNFSSDQLIRALDMVHMITYESDRWEALNVLAPYMPDDLLKIELAKGCEFADNSQQGEALAVLASHMTGNFRRRIIEEVFAITRELDDEVSRVKVLTPLVSQLTGSFLAEGLLVIQDFADEEHRSELLAAMAPKLNRNLAIEGLMAAQEIEDETYRCQALKALIPRLIDNSLGSQLERVRSVIRAIKDNALRAWLYVELVRNVNDKDRQRIMTEVLNAVRRTWIDSRGWILAALIPYLEDGQLDESLEIAHTINVEEWAFPAFIALFPRLTEKQTREGILNDVRKYSGEWFRAETLGSLMPYLDGETQTQILIESLSAARKIDYDEHRAKAFVLLLPYLKGDTRKQVLDETLKAIRLIEFAEFRIEVYVTLAATLVEDSRRQVLSEALETMSELEYESWQVRALTTLTPHLCVALLEKTVAFACGMEDNEARAQALTILILRIMNMLDIDESLLRKARQELVQCLWGFRNGKREDVLSFVVCDDAAFLRAFDLPPEAYAQIAQSIIDICTKWEWEWL